MKDKREEKTDKKILNNMLLLGVNIDCQKAWLSVAGSR